MIKFNFFLVVFPCLGISSFFQQQQRLIRRVSLPTVYKQIKVKTALPRNAARVHGRHLLTVDFFAVWRKFCCCCHHPPRSASGIFLHKLRQFACKFKFYSWVSEDSRTTTRPRFWRHALFKAGDTFSLFVVTSSRVVDSSIFIIVSRIFFTFTFILCFSQSNSRRGS